MRIALLCALGLQMFAAAPGRDFGDTISAAKSLIASSNYNEAAVTILMLRNSVATRQDLRIDFSTIDFKAAATTTSLSVLLDEAQTCYTAHDKVCTVRALDKAQIYSSGLYMKLPAGLRLTLETERMKAQGANVNAGDLVASARSAWFAGDYELALEYSQRALNLPAMYQSANLRHSAHTIAGMSYYRKGDNVKAADQLAASLGAANGGLGTVMMPSLSLASALAATNPQTVIAWLDAASNLPNWRDRQKAVAWKATLVSGQMPDFDGYKGPDF